MPTTDAPTHYALLLEALETARKSVCAYSGRLCDCKYGLLPYNDMSDETRRCSHNGCEHTGCPEIRDLIGKVRKAAKGVPSADPGPTHRAQSGERFAFDIAADLRRISSTTGAGSGTTAVLQEAAAKLLGLVDDLAAAENARDLALPFLRDGALEQHHGECGEAGMWDIRRCEDAHCTERARLLELHGLLPKEWGAYLVGREHEHGPMHPGPLSARLAAAGPGAYWPDAIAGWRHAGGVPEWTPIDPATVDGMHPCFATELGITHHPHVTEIFGKRSGCPGVESKATAPKPEAAR